ncbi:recombinase RecA [Enemella sp. A6]|uniref:recombinase RecA n=1 Tax=Enemella sp. A6 TaxID=3440152 RepID=UPI003EBFADEA
MTATNPSRQDLSVVLDMIEKTHGQGAVMCLGDEERGIVDAISTGSDKLDAALGGGLPRGHIVQIVGGRFVDANYLTLGMLAHAQVAGGTCAVVDGEHLLDSFDCARTGVDTGALLFSQPNSMEQALGVTDMLARSGALTLIVVHSIYALPLRETDHPNEAFDELKQDEVLSRALRKLSSAVAESGTIVVFLQHREAEPRRFESLAHMREDPVFKLHASVRLDVYAKAHSPSRTTQVEVIKNKVAPPLKVVRLEELPRVIRRESPSEGESGETTTATREYDEYLEQVAEQQPLSDPEG